MTLPLTYEQRIYFRDLFRDARFAALRDSEGFDAALFALERFGKFLSPSGNSLNNYKPQIVQTAESSVLAKEIPEEWPDFHTSFDDLYEQIRDARNSAFHEGAEARHLTSHAVLISIILEDALMTGCNRIGDYMIRTPLCASMWYPLSFIRQLLLAHSFSYLPVNTGTETEPDWHLVSDRHLAGFLHKREPPERKRRLSVTLQEAVNSGEIKLILPFICEPDDTVEKVIANCGDHPALVVSAEKGRHLLGIATPFDLL